MVDHDVEQFLWDLEAALSHVDGDERLVHVREAERLLEKEAAAVASEEGADELTWYHYVQATANLGPPERLAAELTGAPLPDVERNNKRLWLITGGLALAVVLLVGLTWLFQGDLVELDTFEGSGTDLTGQRTFHVNVSAEAERVFLNLRVVPTGGTSAAAITVLDGEVSLVYEGAATLRDHLQDAAWVEGAAGHWRIILDLQGFTGNWRLVVMEEV